VKNSCSSKASSISSATEESHEVITNIMKMKEKIMDDSHLKPHELSSGRVLLDLKVQDDYNNEKNLTPAHASESSNEATPNQRHSSKTKIFSCSFCKKEFSTKQALGGYQNAHKQERALSKS
ncbi:hypothetical protein EJD97_012215, partial [Solanum chilense]